MKITIRKKVTLATIFMLLLVSLSSIVGIWSIHRVRKGADIILRELSHLLIIQELRLSFEKVLMPAHDYLIRGDKREAQNFEYLLKILKKDMLRASEIFAINNDQRFLEKEKSLLAAQDKLVSIETLSRKLLSLPDPLHTDTVKIMKKMDFLTDNMQEHLDRLYLITSKKAYKPEHHHLICSLMVSFQRFLMPIHDYLIGGSVDEFLNYRHIEEELDEKINSAKQFLSSTEEKRLIGIVESDLKELKIIAETLLNRPDPLNIEAGNAMKEMDKTTQVVTEELDSLLDFSLDNANKAMKIAHRIQSHSTRTMIGICLMVLALGLAGGIILAKGITKPVKQLVEATQKISAGDLEYEAKINSQDEIGELAESFNLMTEDLKKYRDELIHAKEYIDNILKSMIDTLVVVTPEGTIQTMNQATCSLLGYREEELIDQPIEKIFADNKPILTGPRLEYLIKEKNVRNLDLCYKTKDGQEIPVNFSGSVMKDKMGNILGLVGVARDMREIRKLIEDLKKAYNDIQATQSQLLHSSKLASLGVLSAGVAHEISNPMNVIINYAGLLEDEIDQNNESFSYVRGILQETQRITNIIKSLLTFARQEKHEPTLIYLVDTIDSSLTFTEGPLLKDGIQIVKSYRKELPRVIGSNSQLEQVFVNLILNARDALNERYPTPTPHPNKQIQITADQIVKNGHKYIRVIFHDRGVGIAEEDLYKIFDPFFTTKQAGKGTGLGLSISYGIIKEHKGTLEVESKRGEYAAFIIDLPVDPSMINKGVGETND